MAVQVAIEAVRSGDFVRVQTGEDTYESKQTRVSTIEVGPSGCPRMVHINGTSCYDRGLMAMVS